VGAPAQSAWCPGCYVPQQPGSGDIAPAPARDLAARPGRLRGPEYEWLRWC